MEFIQDEEDLGYYMDQLAKQPRKLNVKRLTEDAKLPTKAYVGDAGFDLYTVQDIEEADDYSGGGRAIFSTGVAIEIPEGYVGIIKDRSGLAAKQGITVLAGVIDSGYRGEIKVVLFNSSPGLFKSIKKGDKIAQLVILPLPAFEVNEVEELSEAERGIKGFGSSG